MHSTPADWRHSAAAAATGLGLRPAAGQRLRSYGGGVPGPESERRLRCVFAHVCICAYALGVRCTNPSIYRGITIYTRSRMHLRYVCICNIHGYMHAYLQLCRYTDLHMRPWSYMHTCTTRCARNEQAHRHIPNLCRKVIKAGGKRLHGLEIEWICMCMYACMYANMYVCACMSIRVYVCMFVCM